MRNITLVLALFLVHPVLARADEEGRSEEAPRRPNIVIILADDLGYADLGCQGMTDIGTPHIDSIAANGVRFTDGYANHPVCAPSRAGLLSDDAITHSCKCLLECTLARGQSWGHRINLRRSPDSGALGEANLLES